MKKYIKPEIEISVFDSVDIITTSIIPEIDEIPVIVNK